MNKRIKELAEQAEELADEEHIKLLDKNNTLPIISWVNIYSERFAELIVRECTGLLEITGNLEYTVNRDPHDYMRGAAIIKRHFGIEEI